MRIKYSGSGGCALTIDNGTLMLDAEEDRYDLNMNISDKTCQDIIDSVKSVDDGYGYNISMVVFDGDVQQFGHAQATSLADVASQSITSEHTMLFNFDRWKVDEIDDTNSWIESISSMPDGYRVATFAAPYNAYDTDWLSYIRTKFVAARSGGSLYYSTKTKSIDLHEIGFLENTLLKGAAGMYDDDQIRARGRWLGERLSMHGGVICMFSHNSKETSITEWSIILDEIVNNYPKVNLVSLRQFHDIVTSLDSGWTKDGNAWTKEIEADYDFHLKPESPCIDAGTDVSLGHDITGCPIPQDGNVDIGAYEYCAQIPEDTTTTTTSYPSCPVAFLLDNDEGSIDLARKFKTDVFLKTPEGKKLVKLYYKHAPELIQILINTPAVYAIATDLLKIIFPKAGDNKSIIINGKIHIKLVELCDAAANHASEGLRKDIIKIKRDIEDGSIFIKLGFSTAPLSSGHFFKEGGKTFRFCGALGFTLSGIAGLEEPVRRLKSDSENLLDELESFDAQFTATVTASWFSEEMNE